MWTHRILWRTAVACTLCGSVWAAAADAVTVDGNGNMAVLGQVTAPNVLQGSAGVAVTGPVTLTESAFGSWHWITGTTADYTIALPSAVGGAGKTIGLRVKDATVASKTYTLAAVAGQTIDGATTITLTANATLVVMSDGTGWARVCGTPTSATPSGFIASSGSGVVPAGWLECNGQSVSRTTYAALFTAIGTTWGAGDGSSTFTLPNLSRRTLVGRGGVGTGVLANLIGSIGGEENHVLTVAEMPSHTHSVPTQINTGRSYGSYHMAEGIGQGTQSGAAGGGQSHNVLQPSAVVMYLIKY